MANTILRTAVILLVSAGTSYADGVHDASLRAVQDRVVRLELAGSAVEGRLLGFDDTTATIVLSTTSEVVSVPRAQLLRVIAVDLTVVSSKILAEQTPEKVRAVGVQFGLPGTLVVDADYKLLRGFASVNVLFPLLTASGDSAWMAGALGGGVSVPMGKTSRWKLDVFGEVVPFRMTSYYTHLAFGVGAGFHYTGPSGFTVGFTFPVVGFSTRLGSSPHGYDPAFTYNDSLGYYYLGSVTAMPLVTMGYRFSTGCLR